MRNFPHQYWLAAILWLTAQSAWAKDWPQFRGPNRDGAWQETGLLKSIPTNGLGITWRAPVGYGWSSPVIAQGRAFLFDAQLLKAGAKERIHCFAENTGKLLWRFEYDVTYPEWAFVPGQGGGPSATPIVESGKIYSVGACGRIHCLDTRTGRVIWERDLIKDYQIAEMSCRPSPLIEGNLLILFIGGKPDASVIALDKRTGKEMWKALKEPVSNSSPLIIAAGGKRQLIVWTGESVTSLNPKTGELFWREPMTTSNNDAIPTPVVQNRRLLVGGLMFELDGKQPAASVLWPESKAIVQRILSHTSNAMIAGDFVYSAKSRGELVCLAAATGKLVWSTNTLTALKDGASIHLTPADGGAFLFTDQGVLIRAELSPQGYREAGRANIIKPTTPFGGRNCAWTPPAYANRHVFARSDEEIICASLQAKPGSPR